MAEPMPDDDTHAVLAANRSFYDAFNAGDFAAMAALWAEQTPVACIHPGWEALTGREAVLDSWRRLLGQARGPRIAFRHSVTQAHDGCVFVLGQELVAGATLAATNAFVEEAGRWRIVLHQASQIAHAMPWRDTPPSGSSLH